MYMDERWGQNPIPNNSGANPDGTPQTPQSNPYFNGNGQQNVNDTNPQQQPIGTPTAQNDFAQQPASGSANPTQQSYSNPADGVQQPYGNPTNTAQQPYGSPTNASQQPYGTPTNAAQTNHNSGYQNQAACNYYSSVDQSANIGHGGQGQPYQEASGPSNPPEPPASKKKKNRFWLKAIACAVVCVILGGAAGVGGSAIFYSTRSGSSAGNSSTIYVAPSTTVDSAQVSSSGIMTTDEIYSAYVNSCVAISTEIVTTNLFGQQVTGAAAGSGFVLTSDGYLVTNYHVIEDATTISATFPDGTEYAATLVGGDSTNDVAVLKIDAEGLTPVVIGDSDSLAVGQEVSTIGNPLGEMTFSQTSGIVSALNREVTMSDGTVMNMIQTDCTINSGNSGGPLFNQYGQVVGITSAKYSNNGSSSEATIEGIGFAIPINNVIDLVTDIMENGYVTGKPSVGVLMSDVSTDVQRYGIPAGAEILAILDGSCADKAGLEIGDIITAVDDTTISSSSELSDVVQTYKAGDTVTLTIYRDNATTTLSMTLDESNPTREEEMADLQTEYSNSQSSSGSSDSQSGSSFWDWFGNSGGSSGSDGFSSIAP